MSTDFKPGDRVRVDGFDAEVTNTWSSGLVRVIDGDATAFVPARRLTKYAEPVKVGDVPTVEQLDAAPLNTVVIAEGGLAAQKHSDGWHSTAGGNDVPPRTISRVWRARVLHVGDAE